MFAYRVEPNSEELWKKRRKLKTNTLSWTEPRETVHTSAVDLKRKRNNQTAIHLNCHCDTERNGRRTSERENSPAVWQPVRLCVR